MGWEALDQWGDDATRIEPLAGGVANDVWTVRVNGHLAVGRLGVRSDADLAWETELLKRLDREGLTVPVPIPTTDGRLFADGVVVMTYVEGELLGARFACNLCVANVPLEPKTLREGSAGNVTSHLQPSQAGTHMVKTVHGQSAGEPKQ